MSANRSEVLTKQIDALEGEIRNCPRPFLECFRCQTRRERITELRIEMDKGRIPNRTNDMAPSSMKAKTID